MADDQPAAHDALPPTEPLTTGMSRRWRVALSLLTVAVVLVGVWGIITRLSSHFTPATVTAQPPVTAGAWTQIALPAPKSFIGDVLASPNDPATVLACADTVAAHANGDNPIASGHFTLWRTHDSGAHWATVNMPALSGVDCEITIADKNPQRTLVTVRGNWATQPPCADIQLVLSNDGGATWQSQTLNAPAPANTTEVYCDVYVTAHHIYSEYSYETYATDPTQRQQIIRFVRSDDDGATWHAADTDLGTVSEFHPYQLGDDDSFVAAVFTLSAHVNGTNLWVTHDAGRHWTMVGKSVGDTFILTPTGDDALPSPTLPWYALTGEQTNYVTLYQTTDLTNWTKIPRLPVPNSAPNVAEVLTILPDGEAVVLGVMPQGVATPTPVSQSTFMKALDVWIWNPHTAQWRVIAAPFVQASGCGLCPGHFTTVVKNADSETTTYIWLYDNDAPEDVIYRMQLPR